ncbi:MULTISPECIES: helix-turn-helix transcriptional regulator [unclassified Enterococcus]|uniref:helix-turn-helix transcriptional regulator n=1 Tax=unclassified Enterococcus TaxID=2608891 RepID=UPI001CE15330|nr:MULTISPECIES: helix-turn-helix transcriptional regulator [unclassified Enterococcus]MCA5013668.1 helix-turn-helix transcriptional regulator [Enterococcus sp. S23]MCA5016918.1 helix-turn-helix transcriptional regulator [Enterococcus sp. S22(2020)]
MKISEKLKEKRVELQLSQIEVAEKLLVSRQTISNWENNRSYPDLENLVLLSQLYQFSLDELFLLNKDEPAAMEKANLEQYAWGQILKVLLTIALGGIVLFGVMSVIKGDEHMKIIEYGRELVFIITIVGFSYFVSLLEKYKIQIPKKMKIVANVVFGCMLSQIFIEFMIGIVDGFFS